VMKQLTSAHKWLKACVKANKKHFENLL